MLPLAGLVAVPLLLACGGELLLRVLLFAMSSELVISAILNIFQIFQWQNNVHNNNEYHNTTISELIHIPHPFKYGTICITNTEIRD